MISLTSEYALRAMVFLAQRKDDWPIPVRTIATETGIPRKYLSAVLGALVRARILDASPGRGGGFSMVRPPRQIKLSEVLAPFEPMLASRRPCPFGNTECNDDDPCAGHSRWKKVKEAYARFLTTTSVQSIAVRSSDQRSSGSKKKRTKR